MKLFLHFAIILCLGLMSFKFVPSKKLTKKTGLTFVPSGTFEYNEKAISVQAFFMYDHEITNAEYREFIQSEYLSKGDTAGARMARPDTSAWMKNNYMQPFVEYYYRHPAYNNYPVVNVSKENAEKYCLWLSKKLREMYPEATINDVRLPSKAEWVYAAKGGLKHSPYPWGGPYVRNAKGQFLANFAHISNANITRDTNGNFIVVSKEDYTPGPLEDININILTPSRSYAPNGYGLYNMSGNASEMVADEDIAMGGNWNSPGYDIQVTSEIAFKKANPQVGFRPVITFLKGQVIEK